MACCYIAASMIAFIINTCDALNVDIHLQYNESLDPSNKLKHADDHASSPEKHSGPTVISIGGMTCAACTGNVETAILTLEGVQRVMVSLPFQEARVVHDADVSKDAIVAAVEGAGYDAKIGQRAPTQRIETLQQSQELSLLSRSFSRSSELSTLLFALGTGANLIGWGSYLEALLTPLGRQGILLILTVAISFHYGSFIHKSAWVSARHFTVNMNTLISVSTTLGISLSALNIAIQGPRTAFTYFQTVAGLIMIVTAGKYLDLLSRRRATNKFVGLYSLLQKTASVRVSGQKETIPASMLGPKDQISIDPHTVIPCDSYVISGTSSVNEAIVTGESMPKAKSTGDFLLAGTRNGPGQLECIVNQDQQGSFLSHLIRTVEDASASKATIQEGVDKITKYFVGFVFLLSTVVSARLFLKLDPGIGFLLALNLASQRMMAILAAACPCALGLATPCAIMAGIDVAWRRGVLMTDGAKAMENLKSVTHIVMDKTGTLTEGKLRVTDMKISEAWNTNVQTLCTMICAAEEHGASAHPVGAAVFREALKKAGGHWTQYKNNGSIKEVQEIAGQGVVCQVNLGENIWRTVCVGSMKLMEENGIFDHASLTREVDFLGSVCFVAVDGQLAGSLILQDTLRPDAKVAIEGLKARGLQITMLTGDNSEEAQRIASHLDIQVMGSSASPSKKLEHIQALQKEGHKVAMIGDGINDGPSLAAADVGIMIAHGNKCLSAGGNVLILASKLQSLLTLFTVADGTMAQVRTNVVWALTYNMMAISLAAGVGEPWGLHISPTVAAAMMSFSSMGVTVQGLRLRQRLLSDKQP